jgi:hypothetical protein
VGIWLHISWVLHIKKEKLFASALPLNVPDQLDHLATEYSQSASQASLGSGQVVDQQPTWASDCSDPHVNQASESRPEVIPDEDDNDYEVFYI